jgi:HEAT repeat protein
MREAGPGTDPSTHESRATELARKIQTERDPLVRAQIVRTIEMYPTRLTSAVLHAATNDPEPAVRIACADAWGKRTSDEAVEHLSELFKKDESIDVRLAAVKGLGSTKNKTAVEKLAPALEDKDPALQLVAVESLKQITGVDLGYDVNKWREYVKAPDAQRPEQSVADRLKNLF